MGDFLTQQPDTLRQVPTTQITIRELNDYPSRVKRSPSSLSQRFGPGSSKLKRIKKALLERVILTQLYGLQLYAISIIDQLQRLALFQWKFILPVLLKMFSG
jgi:hypothetical protein